jgi:hypothetical protein
VHLTVILCKLEATLRYKEWNKIIVLNICFSDSRVDCDGRYEQLILKAPSVNLLSAHLLLTALVNNVLVNPPELKTLASLYKCDIRKCLLDLQFWILSGAGTTKNWDEFSKGKEDGTNQAVLQLGSESKTIVQGEFQIATNDGESTQADQPLGLLDDPGEESLFLTLDDWKTLAKRPTQASRRGLQSGTNALDIKVFNILLIYLRHEVIFRGSNETQSPRSGYNFRCTN